MVSSSPPSSVVSPLNVRSRFTLPIAALSRPLTSGTLFRGGERDKKGKGFGESSEGQDHQNVVTVLIDIDLTVV